MIRRLFGWVYSMPGLTPKERDAYKAFHVFVILSYLFWVRSAFFPFVGGAALLVDRGVKAIFIVSFVWFLAKAITAGVLSKRWNFVFSARAKTMLVLTAYMLILGFYYNSGWASPWSIISCAIYYVTMVFVVAMGRDGFYFRCNWKLFLFLFYLTFVLMLVTSNVQKITFEAGTEIERAIDDFRGTTTLAYSFRGVLQFSLFFFLVACLWREKIGWKARLLMFLTLFPYAYFQIYVQKFRSHILLLGLTFVAVSYYALKSGRIKVLLLIPMIVLVGIGFYFRSTKGMALMRERIEQATIASSEVGESKNFLIAAFQGERGREFDVFWRYFPLKKKLLGGGFKGYFDATEWGRGDRWDTVHIGFFRPLLQGGVFFFLFYLGFFIKAFVRRVDILETRDGLLVAAKALVLIIFAKNWVNPILVQDACFEFFIVWLALGTIWSPPSYEQQIDFKRYK